MFAPLEILEVDGAKVGPHPPAAVTLPELARGGVRLALGTVFSEPDGTGPEGYPAGDVERAAAKGRAQVEVYLTWRDKGAVGLDLRRVCRGDPGVGQVRGGMGVAEVVPQPVAERLKRPLHLGILVENADPIRGPEELGWWVERGVVAVGLAWAKASRYAGGNGTELGLTDLGREMVREMDRLGVVHDLSHLSDRAMDELLGMTGRPVIASHSNSRALLGGGGFGENQRHLRDETIREIARRGGVIGLNLFSAFLRPALGDGGRGDVADCVRHIEHLCEVAGSRAHIGLGSDMDGGFSAARLPRGIERAGDVGALAEALSARGWSDEEVEGFAWGNWVRFWGERRA